MIFDLDGTLIDSGADLAHAINAMLAEYGCAPLATDAVLAMVGDGVARLVTRALNARGCDGHDLAAAQRSFLRHYELQPVRDTAPYPGVPAALDRLRAAGLTLAVCTNKPLNLAERILERLDLRRYFAAVIGGDSFAYRKPDPRVLQSMLHAFDVAPERALMVGDSEIDAQAAEGAGIAFVLMTYGYRHGPVEHIPCALALDEFAALPAAAAVGQG